MEIIRLERKFHELGGLVLSEMNQECFWEGKLSSSALAVAVAVAALYFDNQKEHSDRIIRGLSWLRSNMNSDGSFGDTPESPGNVSTSLLVYAAANLFSDKLDWINHFQLKIVGYLNSHGVNLNSSEVSNVILKHYKNDYTFSVPILTMSGLCGIPGKDAFNYIPQLPFEFALLPRRFYRLLNLSVVSYALPALVAVGIVIFKNKNSGSLLQGIRRFFIPRAMNILRRMLPPGGGFLEAIPLTAFVVMSLLNAGYRESEIVKRGILFLTGTQREDGSWPIDINLSTWVTSLVVKGFRSNLSGFMNTDLQDKITNHFKLIQNEKVHPFNGTGPGGWGWTNYTGSVPDGDDTPAVMLALMNLQPKDNVKREILTACNWLLNLQNKDGGFPTFSRGWGKLPFDKSCSDLTGHNLLAISLVMEKYRNELPAGKKRKLTLSFQNAMHFLIRLQNADGSWLPLWFGNQQTKNKTNPVYGTSRVVAYMKDAVRHEWLSKEAKEQLDAMIKKGASYLIATQNEDGSWGGDKNIPGTIEETALAISALASYENIEICYKGLNWLDAYQKKHGLKAAPIGLYFASLWYDEKMYPITSYLEAVSRVLEIRNN